MPKHWTERLAEFCEHPKPATEETGFIPIRHVEPIRCVDSPFLIGTGMLTLLVRCCKYMSLN